MTSIWAAILYGQTWARDHSYLCVFVTIYAPAVYGRIKRGWRLPRREENQRLFLAGVGLWAAGTSLLEVYNKPKSDTALAQALGALAVAAYAWEDMKKIMDGLTQAVTPTPQPKALPQITQPADAEAVERARSGSD